MLLFAVAAAVCLCVPIYGLAGTEPKSNEFLFLLNKVEQLERETRTDLNQVREKIHSFETKLEKEVNVHLELSESPTCESGEVNFRGDFSTRTVRFNKTFTRVPAVSHGIILLDAAEKSVTRARCDISNVSQTKFDVRCRTWRDSSIYSIFMSWIAC